MKQVSADPIVHRDEYTTRVEKELLSWFNDTIYGPLFDIISPVTRQNAEKPYEKKEHGAIWDALMAGVIWYADGVFSGTFNSSISRELRALGARKVPSGFALAQGEIPIPLRAAVVESATRAESLHREILMTLAAMKEHLEQAPTGLVFSKTVDTIADDLQEQLVQSVSKVEGLSEPAPIPPGFKEELREDLAKEANEDVKRFSAQQLDQLRDDIQKNLDAGARTKRLAEIIEMRFGIAQRRAHGIAEDVVSKLVSDFRKRRYLELGSSQYDWQTKRDEIVRKDHKELDRQRFSWSSPPITNRSTGARNHPGEDDNCRCEARPIFVIP